MLNKNSPYSARLKSLISSPDPKHKALIQRVNSDLIRLRDISPGTVHQNATMSNLSVQYSNGNFIGDKLMPILPVSKRSDVYYIYDKRSRANAPDDAVGSRARANEISDARSTDNYSVQDYALQNFVSNETLLNQDAPLNEMVDLIEAINDDLAMKRELRQAAILIAGASYSGNTAGAAAVWEVPTAGNPITDIQGATAALWEGRGPGKKIGFCSLDVWNAIARHDKVRDLFKYNENGLAMPKQFAQYMGLDDILVSSLRYDTANSGQAASYSRVYGKVFGVVRVADRPSVRNASFGYTFRLNGDPVTTEWYDKSVGKSGGFYGKVGVSEDYQVVAADTGYLLTACIT